MAIIKLTKDNFEQEVLKSDIPVLVDFYADWCGPCKMVGPVVEKLADAYNGKVKVGKLNVDNSMETAGKYRVMSIPTFIIFKDGQPVDTIQGAVPKEMIESKLNAL